MASPYLISVRTLCEFAARHGDLDTRFTPSPTALEGIEGHQVVGARRAAHVQREVNLSASHGQLHIRGRADLYDPKLRLIEEIKTHRGELSAMPGNQRALHWAQARVYAHMLCELHGFARIEVALVYFDVKSQTETRLQESASAHSLREIFENLCSRFADWAANEMEHLERRQCSARDLAFPWPQFRPGQRELAKAVYLSGVHGRSLLAQAPTGIGKTAGCLFPSLKAMGEGHIDRVFYLSAKTSGRQLALNAMDHLDPARHIRILELSAREKACVHPDKACHGESCPLARGFYERLPAAREAAAQAKRLDRETIGHIAAEHSICPYYLGSEMARWSDVVIGDYNYYFDTGGMLYALSLDHQWRVQLLVDEAHNLIGRARDMYSAHLDVATVKMARRAAPSELRQSLSRIARQLSQLPDDSYALLDAPPAELLRNLGDFCTRFTELQAQHGASATDTVLNLYFDALQFLRLAEAFGTHSVCDTENGERLNIRNVLPAAFLKARFAQARSSILFSATLAPWNYQSDSLGLPESSQWLEVQSPFQSEQLDVRVYHKVSTRYRQRTASLPALSGIMAGVYDERPGNYLAFFSSFDYMEMAASQFARERPDIPAWRQTRNMPESERCAFIDAFREGGTGIGFAVLGGAFGEGIDLPGDRLIGAFIATLGLPQFNPVNEAFRERMDGMFGAGYDYTYLYPGLHKVIQAAGRVIRSETDRGIVCLIDERFARADIRAHLPAWWQCRLTASPTSTSDSHYG